MRRTDFAYDLPTDLIAQRPLVERASSRMLHVRARVGAFDDRRFRDLLSWLNAGDLLVFNDTRVLPARLTAHKQTGGRVEIMLERLLDERQALVQIRASKSPKPGSQIVLDSGDKLEVLGRDGEFFRMRAPNIAQTFEQFGAVPLPPYIQRPAEPADADRYQTVYAKHVGAVAAPTAGLHFDETFLNDAANKGIEFGFVTLHVGAGTFQPVRADNIRDHRMHEERFVVSPELARQWRAARDGGHRVIAVGTTSIRCLESAMSGGMVEPASGDTDLFITPGYEVRSVDGLLTNFHLPESTLLMLVAAIAGYDLTMAAYRHAVAQGYRFFSYGDAMLIDCGEPA